MLHALDALDKGGIHSGTTEADDWEKPEAEATPGLRCSGAAAGRDKKGPSQCLPVKTFSI